MNAMDTFFSYLADEKKVSENTLLSYRRDLQKLDYFCRSLSITEPTQISASNLKAYLVYLEEGNFKAATISRNVATIHSFFHYLYKEHMVEEDVSECLQAPKIEKKPPEVLTVEQVTRLLDQPSGDDPKELRDKAMLELLYATGIRVSELIGLTVDALDQGHDLLICGERTIPYGLHARAALLRYLEEGRDQLLKGKESDVLFPSCLGEPMSRQGFWKILKNYGKQAGIETDITPHTLRHSFAAHMMAGGADIRVVSQMLGHSDISTTQIYAKLGQNNLRTAYEAAHPRT